MHQNVKSAHIREQSLHTHVLNLQFTVLVSNKRQGAQQVDPVKARAFASQHGLGFAEVDIPSGSGVEEVFHTIIKVLLRNLAETPQLASAHAYHSSAKLFVS